MAVTAYKAGISIPPLDAPEEDVKAYMIRHFKRDSLVRKWIMKRMALNFWAYLGEHWKTAGDTMVAAGSNTYVFQNKDWLSGLPFPRSTDNLIAEGVDNFVTRLGRKEYTASVRPSKREPEYEAAAKLAKGIIEHDLEKMLWADKREASDFDLIVTGTTVGRAFLDETVTELMALASPDAAKCPGCGQVFASRKVPKEFADMGIIMSGDTATPMMHREQMQPVETDEVGRPPEMSMTMCPTCPEPNQLQDYEPNVDEVQGESADIFGRPMGMMVPKGESMIEVISPHQVYPQNGGVGVEPDECKIWGVKRPVDLEWIASHIPDYAEEIDRDTPDELMKDHPLFGDDAFTRSGPGVTGDDIYPNHAAKYELTIAPMPLPGLENGRYMLAIGEGVQRLCINKPLMEEVEGPTGEPRKVARVTYAAARQKRIPGLFWGWSKVDDALPLNRQLNMLDSMDMDITYKGFPRFVLFEGEDLIEQKQQGGALSLLIYKGDDPNFDLNRRMFAPHGLTGQAYHQKRELLKSAIRDKLGPSSFEGSDVENPPSVKTVGQLEILARSADESRSQMDRARKRMHDVLFTAHMEITWAFQRDDREFEEKTDAGEYEQASYRGTDLLGQTKVEMEARGDYDRTIFQQAAVERGYTSGMYGDPATMSQAEKEEIRDLMGLPAVDTDKSIQVKRANSAWSEFIRSGTVLVVDGTLNDPQTWFMQLGLRWEQDQCLDLRRQAGWDQVLAMIPKEAWEPKLAMLEQQAMIYGGQPPEKWQSIYDQGSKLAQGAGQQALPMPPDPSMGPIPESRTERIKVVWHGMLGPLWPPQEQLQGLSTVPEEGLPKEARAVVVRDKLLRMYAVIQTFRKMLEDGGGGAAPAPMAGPKPGGPPPPPAPGAEGADAGAAGGA